jgi:ADP-ribose pyrophosphatase|nr:NUDIX hydrolase [Mariniblastus sp.]
MGIAVLEKKILQTPRFSVVERVFKSRSRCVIRHPGAVTIVPWVDSKRICMIRNYRDAVGRELIELPAGTREPGESALETAKRELAEETGYHCKRLEPLLEFFVSPGIMDETMSVFVASELTAGSQELMDDEEIEPLIVEFEEAIQWIRNGKICDGKTIAILLYLGSMS